MMRVEVLELGEDGGQWLVLNTMDVFEAQVQVVGWLHRHLIPGNEETFVEEVQTLLGAPAQVLDQQAIHADPAREGVFYRSPVGGTPIPDDCPLIGRNAVVLGSRLEDHRTYLKRRP